MRFLKRVEVHTIFPLFEGALETGRISKSSFRNWVVSWLNYFIDQGAFVFSSLIFALLMSRFELILNENF